MLRGDLVNTRTQTWCVWCGPAGILLWLIGFVFVGGLMPPPKPSWTAHEVQTFYQTNTNGSWWFVVVVFCAWFAVMFFMMLRAVQSHALEEHRVQEPAVR
jgi:hypothetical protein